MPEEKLMLKQLHFLSISQNTNPGDHLKTLADHKLYFLWCQIKKYIFGVRISCYTNIYY